MLTPARPAPPTDSVDAGDVVPMLTQSAARKDIYGNHPHELPGWTTRASEALDDQPLIVRVTGVPDVVERTKSRLVS